MTTSPQTFVPKPVQTNLPTLPCASLAGEPTTLQYPASYEGPLAKHKALEKSQNDLHAQIAALKEKNDYWTRLYGYVEKGIALKIAELTTVKEENNQLKTKNTELVKTVDELKEKMTKLPSSPAVLKRIQQLEDQVRARDLVIELMKKEETERKEKEMQEKLEVHRRQMEAQLGIATGSSGIPILSLQGTATPKVRITRAAKTGRKEPSRPRKKRKVTPKDTDTTQKTGDLAPNSNTTTLSEQENDRDGSSNSTEMEGMEIEQEFNDAFDELFDE